MVTILSLSKKRLLVVNQIYALLVHSGLVGLLEMDELRNISCLSFLVTNALSLSLEFVSSSRCSSVPFGCYPSYKGFCFNFLAFVTEAHIAELKNSNKI
jgi:hypothetical protein